MLRRVLAAVLALTLLPAGLSACQRKVSVQTGERIVCRFGDIIEDTVRTVKVPASEAALYSAKESFGVCARHRQLLSLYREAQDDISANRLVPAQQLLAQVVAADPDFAQAATQLAGLEAGNRPAPDRATTGYSTGNSTSAATLGGTGSVTGRTKSAAGFADDGRGGAALSLAAWAPADLEGFKTGATAADVLALSREYVPLRNGGPLKAVIISVEQFSSGKMASAALREQMSHYEKNVASEKIEGRACTFGTDGRLSAAIGFADGATIVVVEGHVQDGVRPAVLHEELVAVAAKLPVK